MLKRKTMVNVLTLVIIGAVMITNVVSCAPPGEESPEPTEKVVEPTEPPEEEPTEEPTAIPPTEPPEQEPEQEEETTLTLVIPEDPPSFNGAVTDTAYEKVAQEMVLLSVADLDPWGEVIPELAAELPTVENGGVVIDEEAWTMDVTWKLRDDVQWSDGEPVTADDVVFTWKAVSDPDTGIWTPGSSYVDSVEKVDEYSFVVHYNGVYPGYLTQFGGEGGAHIWPEHLCDPEQGFTSWDCNQEPLSNGPYLLEEWVHGDHLTFVRNPNYFEEGKPYVDKVIFRIIPDPAVRKTMTIQGDADVNMWVSEKFIGELEEAADVGVSFSPTGRWVMRLIPNLAARGSTNPEENPHPILSDVSVRKAMRMAIDVEVLTEEIFYGYADRVWTEFFRPPYDCEVPRPEYDPDGAKALLQEAGWTDEDNDGVRECNACETAEEGTPMSIEFAIYAEYGEELDLAQQLVAEMLSDIGFELELEKIQGAVMWDTYENGGLEQTGDFDLNMWDDGYPGIDPTDHIWYYYHSAAAEPDMGWNVMRYKSEEVDALIDSVYTLDEQARKEAFCEIADILYEDVPQILLFTTIDATAYGSQIEGVQSTINDVVTWNVADWKMGE